MVLFLIEGMHWSLLHPVTGKITSFLVFRWDSPTLATSKISSSFLLAWISKNIFLRLCKAIYFILSHFCLLNNALKIYHHRAKKPTLVFFLTRSICPSELFCFSLRKQKFRWRVLQSNFFFSTITDKEPNVEDWTQP